LVSKIEGIEYLPKLPTYIENPAPPLLVKVHDLGYVRYVKHMGDDLDPVNSAKVSFDKESSSFEDREAKLLQFLAREEHTSVFRHSALTFECYAPLLVCRQWWKYVVASSHIEDQLGHNESSRRYITEEPRFYVPHSDEWRSAPANKKQGSGEPIDAAKGAMYSSALRGVIERGESWYEQAMEDGIAPELARLFLPAYGMYVRWRWTSSLGAVMHFLAQRLADDAQVEIRDFAQATHDLTNLFFPVTMGIVREVAHDAR
jgi:thymidylate synthase (FAD)